MCSDLQLLITSPSVLFFPLADVDDKQCHKDEQQEASSTNAKDEDDVQTFPWTLDDHLAGFLTDAVIRHARECSIRVGIPLVCDDLEPFSDSASIVIQS